MSADGRTIEKRYDRLSWHFVDHRHDPFTREWRIGELFRRNPPPFPTASLVRADRRRRTLVFEAIDGDVVGPKFPLELEAADVDGMVALARATARYRPQARFLKRFDLSRRLARAVVGGHLDAAAANALRRQALHDPPRLVFGHGDVTARNVMRRRKGPGAAAGGELVLIDWEWAGWYPLGWELAFLWFTVVDAPCARARVEAAVPDEQRDWFWRSALLIQLLHLSLPGLAPGTPFRDKHVAMRDELVERVRVPARDAAATPGTARTGSASDRRA